MTPQQVDLVQSSFAKVAPIAETAAGLFYNRLFEIAPQTKSLFHVDMAEQGRKLMTTLGVVGLVVFAVGGELFRRRRRRSGPELQPRPGE